MNFNVYNKYLLESEVGYFLVKYLFIWRFLITKSSQLFTVYIVQVNYKAVSNQHPKSFESDLLRTWTVGPDNQFVCTKVKQIT